VCTSSNSTAEGQPFWPRFDFGKLTGVPILPQSRKRDQIKGGGRALLAERRESRCSSLSERRRSLTIHGMTTLKQSSKRFCRLNFVLSAIAGTATFCLEPLSATSCRLRPISPGGGFRTRTTSPIRRRTRRCRASGVPKRPLDVFLCTSYFKIAHYKLAKRRTQLRAPSFTRQSL